VAESATKAMMMIVSRRIRKKLILDSVGNMKRSAGVNRRPHLSSSG
jgi:hypothetical protein